jgi:hypothetical protein
MHAINTIRLLNTAERRHFVKFGRYAVLGTLAQSAPVNAFLDSQNAASKGIGRNAFNSLRLDRQEITPGWKLSFSLSPEQDRYTLLLSDATKGGSFGFSSDEAGIIWEGKVTGVSGGEGAWQSGRSLIQGHPIGQKPAPVKRSRIAALFQTIAASVIVPVHATHCGGTGECCCDLVCCHTAPCACVGTCQTQHPGGEIECDNCGCACCPWCCRAA